MPQLRTWAAKEDSPVLLSNCTKRKTARQVRWPRTPGQTHLNFVRQRLKRWLQVFSRPSRRHAIDHLVEAGHAAHLRRHGDEDDFGQKVLPPPVHAEVGRQSGAGQEVRHGLKASVPRKTGPRTAPSPAGTPLPRASSPVGPGLLHRLHFRVRDVERRRPFLRLTGQMPVARPGGLPAHRPLQYHPPAEFLLQAARNPAVRRVSFLKCQP